MKLRFAIFAFSLISVNVFAIESGISINHLDNQHIVQTVNGHSCTGQLVSGKYVLTAGHCSDNFLNPGETEGHSRMIVGVSNQVSVVQNQFVLDDSTFIYPTDFSIWTLPTELKVDATALIAPYSLNSEGEKISIKGFGSGILEEAITETELYDPSLHSLIRVLDVGTGNTQGGDSGSGYWGSDGLLYGIHRGDWGFGRMVGSRINYVHNFILHNVNGWNYPTSVNVTGSTELRVQSLHLDQTVDASFATGDVVVDVANSTCISQSSISPYDICTYTIQSGGNEGKLHLSPTEFIVINEGDTGEEANSGSGGGATSLWMILGMLLTAYIRKRAEFFKVRVI